MEYQILTQALAPQPLAVVRLQANAGDLSRVIPAACGEVWAFVRSAPIENAGRHVAVYLDGEINIECGVEVAGPFCGDGRVVPSTTPGGRVASTVHIGPYHLLGNAHAAIRKWCRDNGQRSCGPNWEIYGHWNDDPAQVRTDVFYLLDG
ncbi:MAG TPA: GyrI-like domain-containing protein [Pirellulales bacterium]|jgi:effector-binding domain-containing protein